MPRLLPTLLAPLALTLLLLGCGEQPSDSAADVPAQDDRMAALPEDQAETGGYEQIDQSDYGEQKPEQAYVPPQPAPQKPVPQRTATPSVGAGVQGDTGMFYDALDRDGAWVRHPDYAYVWLPSRMGPGWRPYQEGRWIWTDDYGWYWDSDEPFGWAVYHYGRWDYDPDYGWFWVPGDTWAPAWVTWRVGGDSVGWAPIAPDRPGFAAGMPRRYAPPVAESWVFVDAPYFAAPDIAPHVRPISRIGPSLEAARDMRTPRFERNRVVNFGAPPEEMGRYVRGPIERRQIVYVGDRDDIFDDARARRVGIYRPIISPGERRGPPPRLADLDKTRRVVVRQFAGPGPERLFDAPSVALLDVLDARERQRLAEARLSRQQAALDARIAELQRERAAMIEERRKQAKKLEAKLEKERLEAKAERKRLREMVRAEKEKRAAKIKLQAPALAGETAVQTPVQAAPPPAAPPAQSAVAPAEPAPSPPGESAAPPPPAETGAIDGGVPPEERPQQPPASDMGAAEPAPAPAPAPAAAPEPSPLPEPAAEPAPQSAPEPQQAREVPAPEPQMDEMQAPPPAEDIRQERPRKQRRQIEAVIPDQPPPAEMSPPVERAPPPPQTIEPPSAIPEDAAGMPADAAERAGKSKRRKDVEEPPPMAPEPSGMGEPFPPAEPQADPVAPPPAE